MLLPDEGNTNFNIDILVISDEFVEFVSDEMSLEDRQPTLVFIGSVKCPSGHLNKRLYGAIEALLLSYNMYYTGAA